MNLCRACLSSDKDLFQSDDFFVCNYNLLTNLNVKPLDGKSQHFCQICMEAVSFFIEFRKKCASSELSLQEICSQQIIKSEELEDDESQLLIKEEIKLEDEDFSTEVQFEDSKEGYDEEDTFYIKAEENYDVKLKKPRRQVTKHKPRCKYRKKDISLRAKATSEENYTKLSTEKPACGLCGKVFGDRASLNKHLEGHKTDRGCQLCPMNTFEHWPQLLAHRVLHTVHNQNCHMCHKKLRSNVHLEYHYWKAHCGEQNVALACSFCPSKFPTPRKLGQHVWSVHSQKQYICDICSKMFNNKQRLKSHIIGHGDVRRYACDLCGYRSKYAAGLAAHNLRRHIPGRCICKNCERVFPDTEKLAEHVCLDKSKICPVCGKHLRRGLARHLATHGEEKRHKCARCPATYRSRTGLKVHVDKHDNNPTQQCEHCLRRFYSRSVLIKHRRVHTGEKPYACSKCDMRFTGRNNLKVHMKVHGEMLIVKRVPEGV